MKQLILYTLVPTVVLTVLMVACDGEFEPDPVDPRVPRYSEESINAAGALVNDGTWRAVLSSGFLKSADENLLIEQDSTGLRLSVEGNILNGRDSDSSLVVAFYIDDPLAKFSNLSKLNSLKFDLSGRHRAAVAVGYQALEGDSLCFSSSGQLYVRNARYISESSTRISYQLSGTFSFTIDQDSCRRFEVTDGRFDYSVRVDKE